MSLDSDDIAAGKPMLDFDVAIFRPSERLKSFSKGRNPSQCLLVVLGEPMQEHDATHPLALLRAPRAATPPPRHQQA